MVRHSLEVDLGMVKVLLPSSVSSEDFFAASCRWVWQEGEVGQNREHASMTLNHAGH